MFEPIFAMITIAISVTGGIILFHRWLSQLDTELQQLNDKEKGKGSSRRQHRERPVEEPVEAPARQRSTERQLQQHREARRGDSYQVLHIDDEEVKRRKKKGPLWKVGAVIRERYRLEGEIYGGMNVIYPATDQITGRKVAVKVLQNSYADARSQKLFLREASTWLTIPPHPNIVRALDAGWVGARAYIVMEWIEGLNLQQKLAAGKLSPEEAVNIMAQVAEGMRFAREQVQIVHRDLKPSNILLDTDGTARVTDFGLVWEGPKAPRPKSPPIVEPTSLRNITSLGFLGTAPYTSPEQWNNPSGVDQRSDIYSLGIVFFEMLTARLLVIAHSLGEYRHIHTNGLPNNPRKLLDGVPKRFVTVYIKCTRRNPKIRYQSFTELLEHLNKLAPGKAPQPDTRSSSAHISEPTVPEKMRLAVVLYNLKEFKKARRQLKPLRKDTIVGDQARRLFGNCCREMGKFKAAEKSYDAIRGALRDSPILLMDRAILNLRCERLNEATEQLERLADYSPHTAAACFWLSRIHYFMSHFDQARRYCERSLRSDPDYVPSLMLTPVLYGITEMKGAAEFNQAVWPEHEDTRALRTEIMSKCHARLLGVLSSDPGNARALIHVAQCLIQTHRNKRCREFANQALRAGCEKSYVLKWAALLTAPGEGHAMDLLQRACKLFPHTSETWIYHGLFQFNRNDAQKCLNRALRLNPGIEEPLSAILKVCGSCRNEAEYFFFTRLFICPRTWRKMNNFQYMTKIWEKFWKENWEAENAIREEFIEAEGMDAEAIEEFSDPCDNERRRFN